MTYEERNTWTTLLVSAVAMTVYIVVILQQAASRPLEDVDWVPAMAWTIGGSIVVSIAVSILWGLVAGRGDREGMGASDERDRDIARMGTHVGQAFPVIAGLGAIALCAVEADGFWIANTLFFGFALSALVGGAARVIAYRRGLI